MRAQVLVVAVWALTVILSAPVQAQDPTVLARILKVDNSFENYMPLTEATVTVLADGERFTVLTMQTDSNGYIEFDVPLRSPFSLVFHGGADRVPQMTSLAGEMFSSNQIHVCLLTIAEYIERYGDEAYYKVKAETDAILFEIGRVRKATDGTSEELDALEHSINELLGRVG